MNSPESNNKSVPSFVYQDPNRTAADVFENIAVEGEHELARSTRSLWWSGCVAGVTMSLSAVAEAGLIALLPDEKWAPVVTSFGYSVGFLFVILGGLQLFTENTITPVTAILPQPSLKKLGRLLRIWFIVFVSNMVGIALAMLLFAHTRALPPKVSIALTQLAEHAIHTDTSQVFFSAMVAGFMIASLVWSISGSPRAKAMLIVLVTYMMAVLDLAHVVAGAGESFFLVYKSQAHFIDVLIHYILPALAGNILGGTAVFAVLAYAQVSDELLFTEVSRDPPSDSSLDNHSSS